MSHLFATSSFQYTYTAVSITVGLDSMNTSLLHDACHFAMLTCMIYALKESVITLRFGDFCQLDALSRFLWSSFTSLAFQIHKGAKTV